MTTGRINQVRTIGGARARRAPPPRLRAPTRAPRPGLTPGPLALRQARGLSPVQAAWDARARLPAPRRSVPQAGLGAELPMRGGPHGRSLASPRPAPPSASARSRRLRMPGRVSPRLGGACLRPARGPSCPCGVAPTGARSPAPGLRRPQPRPGPGGFRRPGASPRTSEEHASGRPGGRAAHAGWPPRALARRPSSPGQTASPPPSGSHVRSAGASMRQAVARPSVLSGCVLRLGRRRVTRRPQPARFPWDGRPHGKTPPGYAAATARLTPRARLDVTAHRRQDTDAPWPAAGQGLAPPACGAGALAAARGPATVRFAC